MDNLIFNTSVIPGNERRPEAIVIPIHPPSLLLSQFLKTRKWSLGLVLILGVANSILSILLTLIIGDFFLLQFNTSSNKGRLLAWMGLEISSVNQFFIIFSGLLLLKLGTQFLEKYLSLKEGELLVKYVREKLFRYQISVSGEVFAKKPFGQYLLRYSNDLKAIQLLLTKGFLSTTKDVLFTCIGLSLLVVLNNLLGFLVLGYFLFAIAFMTTVSTIQKTYIMASRSKRSSLLAYVTKNFQRFLSIKRNQREDEIFIGFQKRSSSLFSANLKTSLWESRLDSLSYFLHYLMIGIVLYLFSISVITTSVSDGLSSILLLLLLQGGFKRIYKTPSVINKGFISIRKIEILIQQSQQHIHVKSLEG